MKVTLESTTALATINGVPARIWEGKTESGIPVICFITRVAVSQGEPTEEFELELKEQRAPSADAKAFDLRMVL